MGDGGERAVPRDTKTREMSVMRNVLLHTGDITAAEKEVRALGGVITIRLTPTLVVARLPGNVPAETLRAARAVSEEEQAAMSNGDARAVRAFFLKERTDANPDREIPGQGLPWNAPGFEPPDGK